MSGARANLTRGERAGAIFFCRVWRPSQKWPRRCGAEGFHVFFGFLCATLFRKLRVVLFTPPSFCLGVFLFFSPSSWDWGQRRVARVLLASWPSTFLFFLVFSGLSTKALFFPLKRGYFGSFLGVSLSFSLASFTSLCHSLFFFFFFFFLVFSLPCCLVIIFTFLVFWLFFVVLFLCFCFMKRTTSKYYICTFDFHKLFFIRLSQIVFILVLFSLFKSYILVHINVFQVFQEAHF